VGVVYSMSFGGSCWSAEGSSPLCAPLESFACKLATLFESLLCEERTKCNHLTCSVGAFGLELADVNWSSS